MGCARVIEPGMLTTVQDLGRQGHGALGVPSGGAADPLSLRIGNRLVGNRDGAPALEMTLTGCTLVFDREVVVSLAGAEIVATIEATGEAPRPFAPWTAVRIKAGQRVHTESMARGARCYLCVSGGFVVPVVLGAASTHLAGRFGGYEGRALRREDRLEISDEAIGAPTLGGRGAVLGREVVEQRTVRAVPGAHVGRFDPGLLLSFWGASYAVTNQADRIGMRLRANSRAERTTTIPHPPTPAAGKLTSEGMMCGAVELPENEAPIVLMVDHPTTGGYPVIACVATVDLPVLGQLRPGDTLRFERVSIAEARTLFHQREQRLNTEVPRRE